MNTKTMARVLLAAALAALLVGGPVLQALAQGGGEANCNGLSAADCQLVQDAMAAMEGVTALSAPSWSAEMEMTTEGVTERIAVSGAAAIILPPNVVALVSDLPPVFGAADVTALLDHLDGPFVQQMLEDLFFTLKLDELVVDSPTDALSTEMEVVYRDQVIYTYLTAPNGADAWFGQPVVLDDETLAQIQQALDDMRATLEGQGDPSTAELTSALVQLQSDLSALGNRYITTTRGPDQEMDGQKMAAFTTTFDIVGFLSASELPSLMVQVVNDPTVASALGTGEDITEEQLRLGLLSLAIAFDTERTFSLEQWIGLDDHYLHKIELLMDFSLGGELFGETGSLSLTISLAARLTGFNEVSPDFVVLPENYHDLDRSSDFFSGSPDMIEQVLEPGQTVSGTFHYSEGDAQRVYAITLHAGDVLAVTLETENDFASINIYQPDGFYADSFDTTSNQTTRYSAQQNGLYLVVLDGFSDGMYRLAVAVE